MKIAIGADHGGYELKQHIIALFSHKGYEFLDLGTDSAESVDYPDYAFRVGKNVTKGYYNNKEATERVIDKEGLLNTGDLGFMRNGNVIITGRAKDIIFINGQNYYSHDIERVAEEVEGVEILFASGAWGC